MANITISDLRPAGSELFDDSENYLNDLTDDELNMTQGGYSPVAITLMKAGYLAARSSNACVNATVGIFTYFGRRK